MTITEFIEARLSEWERASYFATPEDAGQAVRSMIGALRVVVKRLSVPDPHARGEICADCEVMYLIAAIWDAHPDFESEWV